MKKSSYKASSCVKKAPDGTSISQDPLRSKAYLKDLINISVGSNLDPLTTDPGKVLRKSGLSNVDKSLIDSISIFNQNPAYLNKTPEERVAAYWNLTNTNPQIQKLKDELKPLGTGTLGFYNSSSQGEIQNPNLVVRNMFSGGQVAGLTYYNPDDYSDYSNEPSQIAESGIHIKPENRGKFTVKANRAGKGVREYARQVLSNKENYPPSTVKQANFARNAAKWNKGQDGLGIPSREQLMKADEESLNNFILENSPAIQNMNSNNLTWGTFDSTNFQNPFQNRGIPTDPNQGTPHEEGFFTPVNQTTNNTTVNNTNKTPFDPTNPLLAAGLVTSYLTRNMNQPETNERPELNSYIPWSQGTGSQAIMKYGGKVKGNNGLQIMDENSISQISETDSSNPLIRFNGPSHSEGGIDINYNGSSVEVEGRETGFVDNAGNFNVLGNMKVPGTNMKFKTAGEKLAKKETKYNKYKHLGSDLVNESDPKSKSKIEQFKFNTGKVMLEGNEQAEQKIAESKENLAALQNAMLTVANQFNQKPQDTFNNKKAYTGAILNYDPNQSYTYKFEQPKRMPKDPSQPNMPIAKFEHGGSLFNLQKTHIDSVPLSYEDNIMTPEIPDFSVQASFDNPKIISLQEGGPVPSLSQRHNNPGNVKYASWMKKFGAVKGEKSKENDGTYFAKFPSVNQGQAAMQELLFNKYSPNTTVEKAISTWTNNAPYNIPLQDLRGKQLKDLTPEQRTRLLDTITRGEDSKSYNWEVNPSPVTNTLISRNTPTPGVTRTNNNLQSIPENLRIRNSTPVDPNIFSQVTNTTVNTPIVDQNIPDNIPDFRRPSEIQQTGINNSLGINQIAPELYTLATNQEVPVQAQYYTPELLQPYQMSFQDLRNENQADYNAAVKRLSDAGRYDLISSLAAQKYKANESVTAGQEFRINQQIAQDTYQKNVQILNDAELKNLAIGDQQADRQAVAYANTQDRNLGALSSISGKVAQNRLETKTANLYSQLMRNMSYDNKKGVVSFNPNSVTGDVITLPNGQSPTQLFSPESEITDYTRDKNGKVVKKVKTEPETKQRKNFMNLFK